MAVLGFVLAAAVTLPFYVIGDSALRAAVAAAISIAVAAVAAALAVRIRRIETQRHAERAQLREELREAHRARQDLVEGLPLVTWLYEPGDRNETRLVARQIQTLLGYAPEQWNGELLERILHPEDRSTALAEIAKGLESRAPFQAEYRAIARDGSVVWLREEGRTSSGPDGEPVAGMSFLFDIGDRKHAESDREDAVAAEHAAVAKIAARQSRLDLLHAVGEVAAFSLDHRAAVERAAELVVQDFADWCVVDIAEEGAPLKRVAVARSEPARNVASAPDDEPGAAVRDVAGGGRSQVVPALGGSRDGEEFDALLGDIGANSLICVPLRARRRWFGALTIARTQPGPRYGADELALVEDLGTRLALAIDRAQLYGEVEDRADAARVLEHVADGVLLLDRGGIVRLWNPAAEGITGIQASDAVGRLATETLRGWAEAVHSIPVSATPDPGHPEVVVPLETEKGERWIAVSGVQFFGGTVYAFRDLTEVRRLEELKANFISTASHELRTPLAAVYGAAQTLLRHDFALDEGGRDRFVSLIADESERLGRIVNEILLATQLEAGRLELETEPFDAAELVDRVVEATRAYAPPGVTVDHVISDDLPRVDADREKVRQVLVNLVENAIKYSPDGGRVEVAVEPHDDAVLFSVRDEGLGIPADEQSRIFEKFYRLDPHMTRGVGGTGLGLYICNELVGRMGGHIWVESTPGQGSSFLFELPAAPTSALAASDRERAQNAAH
jgi:PAS domain S-box-containing protein